MNEQAVVRERAQREHREHKSGQAEISFALDVSSKGFQTEREQQLGKAEAKVLALLGEGPIRYEKLQPRILELPLVWNTDLNEILIQGHRSGRFLIEGLGPRERTPKAGCTIRLRTEELS